MSRYGASHRRSTGSDLSKDVPFFVEGQLRLDQWETPQGEKKSRMKVRADRVQFLGGGPARAGRGGGEQRSSSSSSPGDTGPNRREARVQPL